MTDLEPDLDHATREGLSASTIARLFTDARTANTFAPIPVTDHELTEIWELARWAPTSANLQPLRVTYVRSPEARERLVTRMNEGNKAKTLAAPALAILALDRDFHEHIPAVLPFRPELRDVFAGNDGMRAESAVFNSALQAGYFILATRAVGLAAGPMLGFDADAVDRDFFPDGRFHAILVVNIGHPGENAWRQRLPRLEHDTVLRWV